MSKNKDFKLKILVGLETEEHAGKIVEFGCEQHYIERAQVAELVESYRQGPHALPQKERCMKELRGNTALEALKSLSPTISVGMLTADLLNLGSEIKLLEDAGVNVLHFDVMDGVFCPMMTVGTPIVKACKTSMLKDVHLMIDEPGKKINDYVAAGADIISFAIENCSDPLSTLKTLGKAENVNDPGRGIVRGISINPDTPIDDIAHLLPELEMVVLLTVMPGLSGQSFNPKTEDRVKAIKAMRADVLICIDGGVKMNNVADIPAMGADLIVTGSAVFDGKHAVANAKAMLSSISK